MHVDIVGSGPRLVLVHGSGGGSGWPAQRPLADRYTLVIPTRSGYPPNPPLARIDFDRQAEELLDLLEAGDHLVGHSYGGVVSLLAAREAQLRSLTVVEPPAFRLAGGDAAVDELVSRLAQLWSTKPPPEAFLRRFVEAIGSASDAPSPVPPEVEASVRAMMAERPPWEAEIPLEDLRATPFPKLVVSSGHHPAFDAVCDVLERELEAERAVVTGAGHSIPRVGEPFNEVLVDFVGRST